MLQDADVGLHSSQYVPCRYQTARNFKSLCGKYGFSDKLPLQIIQNAAQRESGHFCHSEEFTAIYARISDKVVKYAFLTLKAAINSLSGNDMIGF